MATPLKRALVESGEPQYRIAARSGMTETRLSRLATGRASATLDERKRLAKTLNTTPEKLLLAVDKGDE
jgi:transcriptional regulator with XRE-family HTH domain